MCEQNEMFITGISAFCTECIKLFIHERFLLDLLLKSGAFDMDKQAERR